MEILDTKIIAGAELWNLQIKIMTEENNDKAIEISKQKEDNVSTININEPYW